MPSMSAGRTGSRDLSHSRASAAISVVGRYVVKFTPWVEAMPDRALDCRFVGRSEKPEKPLRSPSLSRPVDTARSAK